MGAQYDAQKEGKTETKTAVVSGPEKALVQFANWIQVSRWTIQKRTQGVNPSDLISYRGRTYAAWKQDAMQFFRECPSICCLNALNPKI